jgi:hypothetical protein
LAEATIISDGSPKKKFSFSVALKVKGSPLDLAAPSQADKLDWLKAFEEASVVAPPVPVAEPVYDANPIAENGTEGFSGWEASNPMPTPMEHMFGGGDPGPKKVDRDAWGGIEDAEDGYGADEEDGDDEPSASTKKGAPGTPVNSSMEIVCSLSQLQDTTTPAGVDPKKKELALSDKEFSEVFAMDKAAFAALPMWHQKKLKKKKRLA